MIIDINSLYTRITQIDIRLIVLFIPSSVYESHEIQLKKPSIVRYIYIISKIISFNFSQKTNQNERKS